ncbi:formyl transferase [Blastocladiella britannica]|nr:formyl transferase [Blastocladiella britannica]
MSTAATETTTRRARPAVVVLISGSGSNLQALIDAAAQPSGPLAHADLTLVVSNRAAAYGLQRAAAAGIPTLVPTPSLKAFKDAGKTRADYDTHLADAILTHPSLGGSSPDLIVLAGWMHILSAEWLARFKGTPVLNLHPALPGQFDGAHAIERAFNSGIATEGDRITKTGCMVHHVIPEVDKGTTVVVREVPILESDTLADLETRIHAVEHEIIVEGAAKVLAEAGWSRA